MALDLPATEVTEATSPIAVGTKQRQLAFAGGLFDLKRGDLYVAYPYWHWSVPNVNTGFYVCNPTLRHRLARSQGYWNEDDNIFGSWPEETATIVEKALHDQGYRIKETRRSYFEKISHKPRADLLLSMRVTDIKLNMCHIHEPLSLRSLERSGGEGVVTVEWEVFDTVLEKVLDSHVTQGYGHVDEPLQAGEKAVFLAAVRDAAKNLGKTKWFRNLMTTINPVDLMPKSHYGAMTLTTRAKTFHQPVREHFPLMHKAIISVRADLEEMGSGFFISNEGHALTTAKRVGDAEFVQLTDSNGTKYRAKVLRTDLRRNVALIKADIHDNMALPISDQERPDSATTVYAIGTPFNNSYRATITKGIIAANRYFVHQGVSFIQASVPTAEGSAGGPLTDEFGNVLGLASTPLRQTEETNFSFFIPIDDALKALNIHLKDEITER